MTCLVKRVPGHYLLVFSLGMLLSLNIFIISCSRDESTSNKENYELAVLPDQNEKLLRLKYQPLIKHLESHTNLHFKLIIPKSYTQLLQWFHEKKIDIALFGGATYVKAHIKSKASPLVMRDVDGRFRSVVLVRVNNVANSLQDLKGTSLAFGSRLSTSGHIMPRYYFRLENIIPEKYFSKLQYSGAHDRTAEWVRDGKVDVGVANSGVVNEMFLDGRLSINKVKIIWQSPPFSDYVWAVQENISKRHKQIIRDAFLHMNIHGEDKGLLKHLGANYYIPADNDDFIDLEKAVLQLEQ